MLRSWPEVTNGLFLSHKRTERERRSARVAEFRRKRPSACTRETGVPDRPRHHLTDRWKLAFPWTSRFPFPPMSAYVSNLSVPLLLASSGAAVAVRAFASASLPEGQEANNPPSPGIGFPSRPQIFIRSGRMRFIVHDAGECFAVCVMVDRSFLVRRLRLKPESIRPDFPLQ